MTTRQPAALPRFGTHDFGRDRDLDLDLTRLHHLRCAAAEMDEPHYQRHHHHQQQQQQQHHQHYDEHEDDPYDEPEPRLEIIDEEDDDNEDNEEQRRHPDLQTSPYDGHRERSPETSDTHDHDQQEQQHFPYDSRPRANGAEEIVRNALFLLALKHPALKQRPATQEATGTREVPARPPPKSAGHPFSGGTTTTTQEEDTVWPSLSLSEADWKGQEDPSSGTIPLSQARADKRARREAAKRSYRDQRRMRRRERRRLYEQQKQPQLGFVHTSLQHPASGSSGSSRNASLLSATIAPLPLSASPTIGRDTSSFDKGAGESVPSLSRKRARVSRPANSDDGEVTTTSYDEAADNDEDIELDDEDDDGDVLLLCEEEILDSGSTTSSSGNYRKRKRPVERKRATADQVVVLEKMYNEDKFPSSELIRHTGERLGMKPSKVKNWFQNKRAKERRVAAGKERPSSAAARAKKAAAASAKKPLRPNDHKQSVEAKEATSELSTASRAPMDVDDPASDPSSSLPFSLLSERRTLALPSSAPPKKRYASISLGSPSGSSRPSFSLPPLLPGGSSPLHFLSSSLSPTLPGDPHKCQRH